MDTWVWAVVILAAGMVLAMLEVFIPSGGILGVCSLIAVVISVITAFTYHPSTGFTFLGLAIIGVPTALGIAFHFFPSTRMGQRMMLAPPSEDEVTPDDDPRLLLKGLIGKHGEAQSVMLPSGRVQIDGQLHDAMSEGLPIEAGQHVVVVAVRSGSLVVRPSTAPKAAEPTGDGLLERPFETWGIDPFEEEGKS
jgi:membrane-bound ClpP family serine protease